MAAAYSCRGPDVAQSRLRRGRVIRTRASQWESRARRAHRPRITSRRRRRRLQHSLRALPVGTTCPLSKRAGGQHHHSIADRHGLRTRSLVSGIRPHASSVDCPHGAHDKLRVFDIFSLSVFFFIFHLCSNLTRSQSLAHSSRARASTTRSASNVMFVYFLFPHRYVLQFVPFEDCKFFFSLFIRLVLTELFFFSPSAAVP